ncbi:reticulon-4-interacting protein 1 homolog, mitochondrial [Nilaparvata lugens]|uniref:reticulon-4-interacting protein 1 homolog, mitochondrial n=1 Tax=Nilaparvata lugens TaxID=108931 RepID=UPI00193EA0AC|nr:reticulon-4-interacting protein 1 homolog, mitochondrial [Nilaparvata lugens]
MLSRLKVLDLLRQDLTKLIRLNSSAYSTISETNQTQTEYEGARMSAWQVHSYGGLEELQFSKHVRMPIIRHQHEVLVRVIASSVNPIDVHMTNGYGNVMLNALRQLETCSTAQDVELPLIMGRDFAGEVVAKGNGVTNLKIGDRVYGVVPVHQQGCHAQNVVVHSQYVRRKPDNVSIEEAASVLYAALTAWSALRVTGDLWLLPAETKKVLVIGGSGGVGTAAIQMLKAWGTEVTTTCSSDAVQLVESLNADHIIDYRRPDFIHELKSHGK